ncbi:MAG TPA: LuxR family transcriptional regulator [Albitalea sp.]|uniref:LuxR family transcriptional regulator n=1 Tax=Piscinibacter sp. TaxID=1903157 RepID=UPI002ED0C898
MKSWQEDLLGIGEAPCEVEVFRKVEAAAAALGFEYCAYGLRMPLPLSNPATVMLNNYPVAWRERYANEGYIHVDPTVLHGRQSCAPLVWSNEVFANVPQLWDEARSFGLCFGWAQSSLDALGVGGMLTLARSGGPLTEAELQNNEQRMRWLVSISHLALSRVVSARRAATRMPDLTAREIEVLKWTADGKSAQEIADILVLSKNTVDFHVKNAVSKLQTANKTAAVVRAAFLGLLN